MYKNIIGFGIAGNFAQHLEQAGESADFVDVIVEDEAAPKGIFPTYVPEHESFLATYPFSSDTITTTPPRPIQMEPEVALLCDIDYLDEKVHSLHPTHFMAYNDCSIRIQGAPKISHKKNWGAHTKGVSDTHLPIDYFSNGGKMDDYSLTSFIKRDDKLIQYGENSPLLGYSYFYTTLQEWITKKLNDQTDQGPLENLHQLLQSANYPKQLLISIGATRYTEFGEKHFLEKGDLLYVVVYPHTQFSHKDIIQMLDENSLHKDISILKQEVV